MFSDITINLPEYSLVEDSTIFVNGDMTKEVKEQLKNYGILSNYLYSVGYNMGNYDCYSINLEKLKYYDPIGFEDSGLNLDKTNNVDCDIKI